MIPTLIFLGFAFTPCAADPIPDPAALVKQLGSEDFVAREAAEKELQKLGVKAEAALKAGLKSDDPEIRTRCEKLLAAIRAARLGNKDSPVWQKFKAVAGDDEDAWKLYLRMVGIRKRGEMLLAAMDDPKKVVAIYAKECDEIAKALAGPQPNPGLPAGGMTADDLAALLFLGTLLGEDRKQPDPESPAVHGRLLQDGLTGATKAAYARLYAAWAEPRPEYYASSLQVGLQFGLPVLAGVARKALAVKDQPPWARIDAPALRFLGLHGTPADIPLVMKFADDKTECGRLAFSKIEGGTMGPWRPSFKNMDVVTQTRDVAIIAALELHKKRPQDFGFELDVVQDGGPPPPPFWLGHLGFCRDVERDAAHKKAKEWLAKQKK